MVSFGLMRIKKPLLSVFLFLSINIINTYCFFYSQSRSFTPFVSVFLMVHCFSSILWVVFVNAAPFLDICDNGDCQWHDPSDAGNRIIVCTKTATSCTIQCDALTVPGPCTDLTVYNASPKLTIILKSYLSFKYGKVCVHSSHSHIYIYIHKNRYIVVTLSHL